MTPTGFMNGQDESRYYVNSSFQVHFSNIYFRQLILNGKIIKELDDSEDEFNSNLQKILILRVIQQICFEMLFGRRKIFYTDYFFNSEQIEKRCSNWFHSILDPINSPSKSSDPIYHPTFGRITAKIALF